MSEDEKYTVRPTGMPDFPIEATTVGGRWQMTMGKAKEIHSQLGEVIAIVENRTDTTEDEDSETPNRAER